MQGSDGAVVAAALNKVLVNNGVGQQAEALSIHSVVGPQPSVG